jgi:hypothetical protein
MDVALGNEADGTRRTRIGEVGICVLKNRSWCCCWCIYCLFSVTADFIHCQG